jgi:hypothetical protein
LPVHESILPQSIDRVKYETGNEHEAKTKGMAQSLLLCPWPPALWESQ